MLNKITLHLARNRDFPDGSPEHGYEFIAPLAEDGHIDLDQWREHRRECRVRRFWGGEEDELGELHHTRHGYWAFSYAPGEEDDEPIFRFQSHAFKVGEYVTITEHGEGDMTFRVISVEPF